MKVSHFIQTVLTAALLAGGIANAQSDPNLSIQTSSTRVNVSVINSYGQPVDIYWMNFAGNPEVFGSISPSQAVPLQTYPGHLWFFGVGQQIVGRYRVTDVANQSFSLTNPPQVVPSLQSRPVNPTQPSGNPAGGTANTPPSSGGSLRDRLKDFVRQEGQSFVNDLVGTPSTTPGAVPAQPTQPNPPSQPTAPPVVAGNTGSNLSAQEAQQLVAFHNQVRAEVGVGAVSWSPQLAQFAQAWANQIAQTGNFAHNPAAQQNRWGENLSAGTAPFSVQQGAQLWYDEKKDYRPGTPIVAANIMTTGHYTQMVWSGTTEIGAATAIIQRGQMRGMVVMVCNYNPAGNLLGSRPY